ncbi:TaqI family restriction endonuclease, partial [Thermus arciformis]|uniref:TaqI family restriction endonuclease n=1 Tax=Thermus arciformis TaxID=482827 RepID=UPI001F4AED7A
MDLDAYQRKYRPIKTVEQDLPRELNPLPDLYEHYWKPDGDDPSFPSYEDFFNPSCYLSPGSEKIVAAMLSRL